MIKHFDCGCITQDSEHGVLMIELCAKHKDKWDLMARKHKESFAE